jgi:hypothetical protein
MSELVERLRDYASNLGGDPEDYLAWQAADRIEALEVALRRCQTVLGNMAAENEGAIFNRWPINHEPLRNDARNLLPVIDAALAPEQDK